MNAYNNVNVTENNSRFKYILYLSAFQYRKIVKVWKKTKKKISRETPSPRTFFRIELRLWFEIRTLDGIDYSDTYGIVGNIVYFNAFTV